MSLHNHKNIKWVIITSKKQRFLVTAENRRKAIQIAQEFVGKENILTVFPKISYWGTLEERVVYVDQDFAIVRHRAFTETGFVFEVVPLSERASRLDDIDICPEQSTLFEALQLAEENRRWIQKYKNCPGSPSLRKGF